MIIDANPGEMPVGIFVVLLWQGLPAALARAR
jgi:hypothetical protein